MMDTVEAAAQERAATARLLAYLCEVHRRRLFAAVGCASLFRYCVEVLRMSEPQAARRVNAARLLAEFPEVGEKLAMGKVSLSALSEAQVLFRKEQFSSDKKAVILTEIEGLSARETTRKLLSYATGPAAEVREGMRPITEHISKFVCLLDDEAVADMEYLREQWAHAAADWGAVVKRMARLCRAECERVPRARKSRTPTSESRHIPVAIKRAVRERDSGRCTYVDPESGRACQARFALQFDHIVPFAQGGETSVENLRLRCRAHNQWHAMQTYGPEVINFNSS